MHPIYESVQLTSKSLTQLKEIAEAIACTEITDKRRKQDWINAILSHQSSQLEKLETSPQIQAKEQSQTCATCPLFKPFNDGTGRGLCCASDTVSRDHHPQTGDCSHLIEEANNPTVNLPEGNKTEYADAYIYDGEAWIDIYQDSCLQASEKLFEDTNVDTVVDPEFGIYYRIWKAQSVIGTFYRALDGYWVAQPFCSQERPRSHSCTQAQLLILEMSRCA